MISEMPSVTCVTVTGLQGHATLCKGREFELLRKRHPVDRYDGQRQCCRFVRSERRRSNPVLSSMAAMCVNMPAASWHTGRSGAVDEVGTSMDKAPVLFGDLIIHSEETRMSLILSVLLEAVLSDLIQAPVLMTTARSMAVIVLFTIAVYGVDVSRPIRASAKGLVAVWACVSSPVPTTGASRALSGVETREKPLWCRRSGLFDRTRSSDVHHRRGRADFCLIIVVCGCGWGKACAGVRRIVQH